jgi:glycosyltransferase involved in cell wall biosynthesis
MIYARWLGSHPLTVGLKYLIQAIETLWVLARTRPRSVFVMTPPVFAALPVWLYGVVTRTPFVIDAHTAAFMHPRWTRFQGLQMALCRRAATTNVTNEHLAGLVRAARGHATLVRDVPVVFQAVEPFPAEGAFVVAVICSFNYDEPIAAILDAARELSDVRFYMTGNPKHLDPALAAAVPPNVTLTGFVPDPLYAGLLQRADAVLTLTTRDHTMLRGAYEAVYQGTPVIVSDWPVLRAAFDAGAVHVDNSAASIAEAVREMRRRHEGYRRAVQDLRARKLIEWDDRRTAILARIAAA